MLRIVIIQHSLDLFEIAKWSMLQWTQQAHKSISERLLISSVWTICEQVGELLAELEEAAAFPSTLEEYKSLVQVSWNQKKPATWLNGSTGLRKKSNRHTAHTSWNVMCVRSTQKDKVSPLSQRSICPLWPPQCANQVIVVMKSWWLRVWSLLYWQYSTKKKSLFIQGQYLLSATLWGADTWVFRVVRRF